MDVKEALQKLIARIPTSLKERNVNRILVNEHQVHLPYCNLHSIPDEVFYLKELDELFLPHNSINFLSEKIGDLSYLTNVDLRNNQIASVPDKLMCCQSIKLLSLAGNSLNIVPNCLEFMTNLREVDLAGNHITSIPRYLSDLNLTRIDLSYNKIEEIPNEFTEAVINSLTLNSNPLVRPPSTDYSRHKDKAAYLKNFFDTYPFNPPRPFSRVRSDLYSFMHGVPTVLAVAETLLVTIALVLISTLSTLPIWLGLLFAPIVLMRNEKSSKESMELLQAFKINYGSLGIPSPRILAPSKKQSGHLGNFFKKIRSNVDSIKKSLELLVGVFLVKIIIGLKNLVRIENWMSIPRNYRKLLTSVDSFSPTELIPGVEQYKCKNPNEKLLLTLSDLENDLNTYIPAYAALGADTRTAHLLEIYLKIFSYLIIALSTTYRMILKGSVLFHLPMLFTNRYPICKNLKTNHEYDRHISELMWILKNDSVFRGGWFMSIILIFFLFWAMPLLGETIDIKEVLGLVALEKLITINIDFSAIFRTNPLLNIIAILTAVTAFATAAIVNVFENRLLSLKEITLENKEIVEDDGFRRWLTYVQFATILSTLLGLIFWIMLITTFIPVIFSQ